MFYNHLRHLKGFTVQNYTRRQLKEDKFAATAQGAVHWASDHRKNVILAITAVLVITLAVIGFLVWNNRQTERANIALGKAERTFIGPLRPPGTPPSPNETTPSFSSIAERGKQAEKEFKSVADSFPYTKPGKIARYMEGAAAMQAGETATAEKLLKSVADSGDKDLAALAKLALASLYISSNRQGEAAKMYKDLADHPSPDVSKAQAQLSLAEMYEATDPKQAAALYQQIEKENPDTAVAQIAHSKVANAGK
jgi:predicted negative regulator of RcsB-dependent stress response